MATKQPKPEVTKPEGDAPASAYPESVRDNGAGAGREPSIETPAESFDERTGAGTPPWQREDGSQDNGEEAVEE